MFLANAVNMVLIKKKEKKKDFFATRCDYVRSASPTVISAAASLDATAAVHKPLLQQEHGKFSFVSNVVLIVWNTLLSLISSQLSSDIK